MLRGELITGAFFGLLGVFWIIGALNLPYMSGFAPGSGFLPLWLGIALVALSSIFILGRLRTARITDSHSTEILPLQSRPVLIVLGLIVCIGMMETVGFVVAITAYLLYLTRWVERESWLASLGVSIGAALALHLIFRTWLSVPLPRGPWGF